MANWKRIKQLRDDLNRPWDPKAFVFDMSDWVYAEDENATVGRVREGACGTACCLAGAAALMFMEDQNGELALYVNWPEEGMAALGLTDEEAQFMFHGNWYYDEPDKITQEDAVRYLNKVLKEKNVMVRLA